MAKAENKTLVFGASLKEVRYSNKAIKLLTEYGHTVLAVGGRAGIAHGVKIMTGHPTFSLVHTVSIYMRAKRQEDHLDYLLNLNPKRIIFNPGAENPKLFLRAKQLDIEVLNACTLVMLRTNQY